MICFERGAHVSLPVVEQVAGAGAICAKALGFGREGVAELVQQGEAAGEAHQRILIADLKNLR